MEMFDWTELLQSARVDATVNISIAKVTGDAKFSTYVTRIKPGGCVKEHFHRSGSEAYHIIFGAGKIVLRDIATGKIDENAVYAGTSFEIPQNVAHSLVNTGQTDIVLLFSCPENHLTQDRFVVDEA